MQKKGFTLIELLVVMVIMSVSLSLVLPLTVQQIDAAKYRAERTKVVTFLNQYQSLSFFRAEAITLYASGRRLAAEYAGKTTELPLEYVTFEETTFQFTPNIVVETIDIHAFINEQPWRLVIQNETAEWFSTD